MADSNLTLRSVKGSALSHQELDQNFKELFYSASISGSELYLYRSQSTNRYTNIQLPYPKGPEYAVQFKLGNVDLGPTVDFSGSKDFTFDYNNKILTVTGSSYLNGDLTVDGTVIARAFQSETIIETFSSGSTSFGNDSEDKHIRTGSLYLLGDQYVDGTLAVTGIITGSTNFNTLINKPTLVSGSSQIVIQSTTGYSTFSQSIDTHLDAKIATVTNSVTNLSGSAHSQRVALINNLSSSVHNVYLKNTTDTLNGDLTVTGRISATEINTTYVSSSIAYSSGSNIFGDEPSDLHQFTGSVDINGNLALPGILNVSASIAALAASSGSSNVSITNNANNRILTATGTDVLNGETNLTFDGSTLGITGDLTVTNDATINGTLFSKFTGLDGDINGLIGGSNTGTLIKGLTSGHVVIGLQEDSLGDSFAIIGGGGDYYSTTNYDKLLFKISGSGQTYIGGPLTVDGAITSIGGDIIAFASSDERLKDNIKAIPNAVEKVQQIGGYEFDWNNNSSHSGHDVGVIAQEIEKVLPEIVTTRNDGYKAVRYEKIVALLIEAVKQQQLQIEELKSKL
jgi:hypothetical protein